MLLRPSLLLVVLLSALTTRAESPFGDGSSPAAGQAEAERLYERANDFVANISENDFSYSYLQFYWKRAQANLDRILRVYPTTPTALGLKNGTLKLGSFEPT